MLAVLDTTVIVAALHSSRGASFAALRQIGQSWTPLISVPLILEYEGVAKREAQRLKLAQSVVDAMVRAVCYFGRETEICFSLRPALSETDAECLVELAVAGRADALVTRNAEYFPEAGRFGIAVVTPREFLNKIAEEDR